MEQRALRRALALLPALLIAAQARAGAHAYFGAGMAPVKLSGFKAVELSDWQAHGLGAAEGRLALDLGPLNREHHAPAFSAGLQGSLDERLDLRLDLTATVDDALSLLDLGVSAPYKVYEHEGFSVAFAPRLGYMQGQARLGTLKPVAGKGSTVILGNAALRSGDAVTADLAAVSVTGGLSVGWKFMHIFGLQLDLGYTYTDASAFELKANGLSLDRKHPAVTVPGGGAASAGLHPHTQLSGALALLSLMVWAP